MDKPTHNGENEPLSRYFALSYQGLPMEDVTLAGYDHGAGVGLGVDLYRCRMCAALTDEPVAHAKWHEGIFPPEKS